MSKNRRHRKLAASLRRKARSQAQQTAKRKEHTERQAAAERAEAAPQAQTEDTQQTHRMNRAARRLLNKSKRPKLRLAKDPTKDRTYVFLCAITGAGASTLAWTCSHLLDDSGDTAPWPIYLMLIAIAVSGMVMASFGAIGIFFMRRREQIEAIEALSAKESEEANAKASSDQQHQDDHDLNQSQQILNRALTRLIETLLKLL